jgi:hypothetical protein
METVGIACAMTDTFVEVEEVPPNEFLTVTEMR